MFKQPLIRRRWYAKPSPEAAQPSQAAVAFATRITEEQFRNVYVLANLIDQVAEEARENERKRIFSMSFFELCHEFWKGRNFHDADT